MTVDRNAMVLDLLKTLITKSGVREWQDLATAELLPKIAYDMVSLILDGPPQPLPVPGVHNVALPDIFKISAGTAKTVKSSGGSAAITLASLANGNGTTAGGRQSATLDLGAALFDRLWRIDCDFELAATPTAGNVINLYGSFNDSTGAGRGNTSGSDAAYSGYSSNLDASAKQLEFLGAFVCTAQATATVQKGFVGLFMPKGRYLNLVVDNRSGAAFHSSDSNCVITLTPLQETIED